MPKIVIAATPVHGHVAPLLTVAADLVKRGHEVTVLTGAKFKERAEAIGAFFTALPEEADYDEGQMDRAFPERDLLPPGPARTGFDIKHIFGDPVPAQYEALRSLLADFPATAVISDSLFLGALPLSLSSTAGSRPITVSLGISPPPPATGWGEEVFVDAQQHLEKVFESIGTTLPGFVLSSLITVPDHYLQLTIPEFEHPRDDLPGSFRFVGPLPSPPAGAFERPSWWKELSQGRPVVVTTQGTFANMDLEELVIPTVRVLGDADVLVVAATARPGGADEVRNLMGNVPNNARLADFVPFDLLLPFADVLVTNGGYGGVHTALRYGVPLVVGGATEDKPRIAALVEWSGAGVNLGTARPDDATLHAAVNAVLSTPSYRTRAQELQGKFTGYDALESISRLVDATAHEV
ncbi:glycosyltransferase [Nonomuraea jiangxiensis]|uniref:UDP:flavonoid glycosyltransferase YjiC, YdhE family n=1 Tax=Nonomuraea jiangxiensis TaxID=633440 RepID=A0A1G8M6E7_9ACTN|nr:nucleotide disphospho-sugar-binding domain-containing protein [Nonomuraea jiangxiensis]SDI63491.1 UDP:flavonoid glycosyltransferase YjiC, YdhE family [Nonomuraea jiangxiensis]